MSMTKNNLKPKFKVKPRTAEQKAVAIAVAQQTARSIMASHRAKAKAEAKPAKRKNQPPWRDTLRVHPACELFPLMSKDELRELGKDIKKNGLKNRIILWAADPNAEKLLLDGRNRCDAMELVGLDPLSCPQETLYGNEGVDPCQYVVSANIHRRHLTAEEKDDLIRKLLKAKPETSNLQIAKQVKRDDKTVAKIRREMEGRSEIPNVEARTDTKGRKQPANKVVELRIANEHRPPTQLPPQELQKAIEQANALVDPSNIIDHCVAGVKSRVEIALRDLTDEDDRSVLFEKLRTMLDEMRPPARRAATPEQPTETAPLAHDPGPMPASLLRTVP